VADDQPLIATDWRPATGLQALALALPLLSDGLPVEVEDADRAIAAIAVLGMREHEAALVAREIADPGALLVLIDAPQRLPLSAHVHGRALLAA
jgi:hypothetical protein